MGLLEITYYRSGKEDVINKAKITECQVEEIKKLPHIHITDCKPAPKGGFRDYILK